MYDCLKYIQFKFYARFLIMFTIFKNRKILRNTKNFVENIQLQIIYNDINFVMININVDNIKKTFKINDDFKRLINERYKFLKID